MRLPWAAGEAPRFVCDTMTEGLARQLRMFGVDAASAPGGQTAKRYLVYRCRRSSCQCSCALRPLLAGRVVGHRGTLLILCSKDGMWIAEAMLLR